MTQQRVRNAEKAESWFDEDCETVTIEKNKAYLNMIQKGNTRGNAEMYKNKRKEEKKIHKKKKREYENKRLAELEEFRNTNEVRRFYRNVNSDRKCFKPHTNMCKDSSGKILTDKGEILKRWKEYFNQLLNENHPHNGIDEGSTTVGNDDYMPTIEEVDEAIMELKNNKAPGIDDIQVELLKCASKELVQKIYY